MMLLSAYIYWGQIQDTNMQIGIYNEIQEFIDEVCDIGTLTANMKESFYLGLAAQGITYDVELQRYSKITNPINDKGDVLTSYVLNEDLNHWQKGDKIIVTVKVIGFTQGQRLAHILMPNNSNRYTFRLAGRIRQ